MLDVIPMTVGRTCRLTFFKHAQAVIDCEALQENAWSLLGDHSPFPLNHIIPLSCHEGSTELLIP